MTETPAEPLDLTGPIREAMLGNVSITALLAEYEGYGAVFTRRPTPDDAPYPMGIVSPPISVGNMDYLKTQFPMPRFDIAFYGKQPDDYRTVEALAYLARTQFHRKRFSVDLSPNFSVLEIVATGPMAAPTDDMNLVGRLVALRFKLEDLSTR